ncbi:MAG TPA: amino acid adenylation domain-containing protein, partial [Thermoanaerobaculia bacterium]|nr:amino acid adenylation domain-containing protein [Thermoanaerobaculia bacterium]
AKVAEAPEAVALVSAVGHAVTYGELGRRAARLAHCLRAAGVGPERRVGVLLDRSPEEVTSLLAVFEAGGAYVPLDPVWPRERVALVLEDAGVRVVLSTSNLADRLPGPSPLLLDRVWDKLDLWSSEPPAEGAAEVDHLAYVIYTSGSTGRPKGVEIEHRGLLRLLAWHRRAFGVTAADRATRLSGLAFDAAVWELWPYLVAGASVHVPDEEVRTSPSALHDWLNAEGITIGFVSTPVAEALLPLSLTGPAAIPLRVLLTGGDRLHHDPGPLPFTLVNNYGPTESTVVATSGAVQARGPGRAPDIGQPIDDTRVLLLDRELRLVPPGVAGEICIGGPGLARGYLGQPGLTAERFVPDPYAAEPGERLYRTGDLARHLTDGAIEFLGRIDFQVKIRGLRIELGEIEAALSAHPQVREAAVLVREDRPGEPSLVAYVAAHAEVSPEALRSWLRGRLPEAMVPSAFVLLDSLPLTPNGKLDRKALEKIAPVRPDHDRLDAYVAPRTPAEEVLAGIFAEVLRLERVSVEDGFFDLGGHSLLATQVISRVREAFGAELPVRELFEEPTAAGLAGRLALLRDSTLAAPPIVSVPRPHGEDGELPLSFAQQRLWFLERLAPGSPAYNVPLAVRISGPLSLRLLAQALEEVARRHEALRTTFAEREGHPVQVIAPLLRVPLEVVDLSGLPPAQRETELVRRATAEALLPFDLEAGPLVRAALLRLAGEDHALLVTMHHIVTDGWSMGIFLRELTALYGGRELPVLPVQYADFAAWQRAWLTGDVLAAQLGYWRQRLSGAPARLILPTDRPRPPVETHRGASRPLDLPPALSRSVALLARREGATPFMVLLAGFAALLGRYSGQGDVVVGSPIAGRNRREIEGLIGFFINTLALRVELADAPDFPSLLCQVRRTALDAYAHQDIPFERLVEELVSERGGLDHSPLFQVMLTVQNTPAMTGEAEGLGVPGVELRRVTVESATAKFELSLGFSPYGEELAGGLEYNTDLFDAATAERMARHFVRLLDAAVASPETPLPELPLLAPAEERQILGEWNDTTVRFPESDRCLHELIREQARRRPEAVAVAIGDEQLSYGELQRRADGLARRLVAMGAVPGSVVGVRLERSLELIVALVGVLEAGAAYLPLDPSYPQERLAFLVEDA